MARTCKQTSIKRERRRRILLAAQKLIAQHGFEATSTKRIAEEAHVPSGLVFYYFASKNDLIEAIFDESPHMVELALKKARNSPRPLEDFLRTYYNEALAHRYQMQIVVAGVACCHPISGKVSSWRGRSQAQIANFLRSLSPETGAVEPEVIASAITACIVTAVLLEEPRDVASLVDDLTSLVRSALPPMRSKLTE